MKVVITFDLLRVTPTQPVGRIVEIITSRQALVCFRNSIRYNQTFKLHETIVPKGNDFMSPN